MKKSMCLIFSLVLIFTSLTTVLAYEGSGWVNEDPTTWSQLDTPSGELPLGRYDNGLSLAEYGCAIHSATAMYIKYGARERGYIPKDFREEALKMNANGGQGGIDNNGLMMWGGVSNQSNGYFAQPVLTVNPTKAQIQGWMKDNLGVIAEVKSKESGGSHYVFLDSLDGDEVMIIDSGWSRTKLSEYKLGYDTISDAWVYKPLKNENAKSLYKDKTGSATNTEQTGNTVSKNLQLSENQLLGLANLPKGIADKQDKNIKLITDFPSRDQEAQTKAQFIRDSVSQANELKYTATVRLIISIVGWIVLLMGIARLLIFIVDAKMGTNIYSKLNFGGKKVVDVGIKESKGLTGDITISWRGGLATNIGLIILGFFILSGMFYSIILRFLV